jgi:hypothetical protein
MAELPDHLDDGATVGNPDSTTEIDCPPSSPGLMESIFRLVGRIRRFIATPKPLQIDYDSKGRDIPARLARTDSDIARHAEEEQRIEKQEEKERQNTKKKNKSEKRNKASNRAKKSKKARR